MKQKKYFFLALICLSDLFAQERAISHKIKKHIEPGGVEYIFKSYNFGHNSKYSDHYPCLDCDLKVTKLVKGKQIYDVIYHLDEYGMRTTSASGLAGKTKHFFLIDGSVAFSEGLADESALIDLINRRSKTFRAYDIGFLGHGPQHNWLAFYEGTLKNKIVEKNGAAVLISHDQDIMRFIGAPDHLAYAAHFPYIAETSPGKFELRGTFESGGSFKQKFLIKTCVPFLFCRTQMTKWFSSPSEEEIARAARFFNSIEKMYREQFSVESFTIMWTGTDSTVEILKKYVRAPVKIIHYDRFDSNHPSALGAKQIVDAFFAEKLIY